MLCVCMKDTKQKFSPKFLWSCKPNRLESGHHLWKCFIIWWKAWSSLWIAHLQNHLQRKGDVSKCLRTLTMRGGLWPLLTRKVTPVWTLKFAVVLWNDWTRGQWSVIGKQCSQLCRIGKGGAQCRLPCDFPVKSGGRIYFIDAGYVCWCVLENAILG